MSGNYQILERVVQEVSSENQGANVTRIGEQELSSVLDKDQYKHYILESKWGDWEKYVDDNPREMVGKILQLLKMIYDGEVWEKIQQEFDKIANSPYDYLYLFYNVVGYFSKRGDEVMQNLRSPISEPNTK